MQSVEEFAHSTGMKFLSFFNLTRVLYYLELTFKRRIILAELKEFTRFIFDRLSVNVNSRAILYVINTYLSNDGSIFGNAGKCGL